MNESTVYKEKVMEVEPFGIEPIPLEERHGKPGSVFNIWFAININIITWFTGFLGIEFGLSLKDAVIAIVVGNLLGAVFLALTSAMGPKTGIPQIVSGRSAFGSHGNWIMALINWIANMGWFAVDILLAVFAIQRLTGIPYLPSLFGLTLITIVVAVYGYNFIHTFAKVMTVLLGALFVFMTFVEIKTVDINWLAHSHQLAGPAYWGMFALALAVAFSYQISFCPIGADYSRYLAPQTSSKKVWLATFAATLTVGIWLEILGAVMATMGQGDPMALMEKVMGAFAVPALITVILGSFPVNAIAIYSGGLSALAMGIPLKRWTMALLTGGLGALAISWGGQGLADTYKNFLLLISYWIGPWLGIILVDHYFLSTYKSKIVSRWQWEGIASFLAGLTISVPFMGSALYTGFMAKNYLFGADLSYFIAMGMSAIIYYSLQRRGVRKEAPQAVLAQQKV